MTLNSLGLFRRLGRRDIIFNKLEVELYSMNQTHIHNPIERIPNYMIRGYPRVHTNPKSKIFLGIDDLSHKMRGMRVP